MTSEPTPVPAPHQNRDDAAPTSAVSTPAGRTGPLLAWLVVQFALLLLPAFRIPLTAQYPEPAEKLAAHLMLGGQVVASGLLFPFLLRDLRSAVQVMTTALPFQLAAGYLAGLSLGDLAAPAVFVDVWLLVLGFWAACLTSPRLRLLGVAVASCLTLGAGLLRYLRLEFAAPGAPPTSIEMLPPLPTTLAAVGGTPTWSGFLVLLGLGAAAIFVLFARMLKLRHAVPQGASRASRAA